MVARGWGRVRRGAVLIVVAAVAALGGALAVGRLPLPAGDAPPRAPSLPEAIRSLAPGWSLKVARAFPESVNSLRLGSPDDRRRWGNVYVGTAPTGSVYEFSALLPVSTRTVAQTLGDWVQHGNCCINRLELHDLDRDGEAELLASTSQIIPRGRPRFYAWSLGSGGTHLRGMARPEIRSSWGHGIAALARPDGPTDSLFATFCGFGEIVEYRLEGTDAGSGFRGDSMIWKAVGQLPASGEWIEAADLDNDGAVELCVATGYGPGAAAIHAYTSPAPGAELRLKHRVDEGGRFGNVRFVVGDLRGDGTRELMAWWCTDYLYGGDCAIIRYRLGPEGVRSRTPIGGGPAGECWPDDAQMAVVDLDRDGSPEVWFAARSGYLWRLDPRRDSAPERILHVAGGLGPLAAGTVPHAPGPILLLGWGRSVLRLEPSTAGPAPASGG